MMFRFRGVIRDMVREFSCTSHSFLIPNSMIALSPLLLIFLAFPQPQPSKIKHIDFYGLRTVSLEDASKALGIQPGDSLKIDRPAAKKRLLVLESIADAVIIEMFMPGNEMLLVGVQEKGSPVPVFHNAPSGDAQLPPGMMEAYSAALKLGYEGMMKGKSGEERINGHSFPKYGPAAKQQHRLAELALANPTQVRTVLRHSKYPEQRAVAANAISYFEDKKGIIEDLVFAVSDPDSGVRNNAIRALSVLAEWANGQDEVRVEFDFSPLIVLLESLKWTDRNKAAALLDSLTFGRDEKLLNQLRENSIPALSEMSKWHSVGHAVYSIHILGRLARISEEEIFKGVKKAKKGEYSAHVKWIETLERLAASREKSKPNSER